jgi:hypothetical protein
LNIDQLLTFAKLSATTYDDPVDADSKFRAIGFRILRFFDVDGAQGYFLTNGTINVLSFRGTEVKQKSDILADLEAGKNVAVAGGKVHHGFKAELDKLWPSITETITNNPGKFYVTGHSLGAAMATIAASRLQERVISLVTFGSPRVGDADFVKNVNIEHYRVQNNNDAVTKVPFYIMGFRHHGEIVYLNHYGSIRELNGWQRFKDMIRSRFRAYSKFQFFNAVYDHLMANYIAKLEKSKEE